MGTTINTCLFLDRDGVINKKAPNGDYIKRITEFEFLPGVLYALRILAKKYHPIIVVTNQQGVGKGVISKTNLLAIHSHMIDQVKNNGGRIDGVYYCPHLERTCNCRKPQIGLALQAQHDFPDIDFKKSIMVGDSKTDLEFGHNIHAKTYLVTPEFSLLHFSCL